MKKILIAEIVILVLLLGVAAWMVIGAQDPAEAIPVLQTEPSQTQAEQTNAPEQTEAQTLETTTETTLPEQTTQPPTEPDPIEITWMTFPEDREIHSARYFVYDVQEDTFVTRVGDNDRVYPASITKLFTCYVAMQYLSPDSVLTVGDELDLVAWDSSIAGLFKGDRLSVALLVEGLLLPSGNDAAYVLAANAGRVICGDLNAGYKDAVEAFIQEMNRQAALVGMTGSHFVNPDGIHDDNHYMSLDDLALLGKLSLENPAVMEVTGFVKDRVQFSYTADRGEDAAYYGVDEEGYMNWKNTNILINPTSDHYCPYATGLKTGMTAAAGSCLLSSFEVQGKQLVIGVFGGEDRFEDTLQLFNEYLEEANYLN